MTVSESSNANIKACFKLKLKHACQDNLYLGIMNTSDRIRQLLRDAAVPERQINRELADTCDISVQAVTDWFSGKTRRISPEYLAVIAQRWGSTTDYLITGKHPVTYGEKLTQEETELITIFAALPKSSRLAVMAAAHKEQEEHLEKSKGNQGRGQRKAF